MPAPVVAGRASTVERENYSNNAAWIDALAAGAGPPLAAPNGMAVNKGFPGTTAPASSSLNAHLTSATVVGNDCAGTITLVTDGSGIAQNQTLCLITFANASLFANTPIVNLVNMSPGAGSTTIFAGTYGVLTASKTVFSIVALGAALTASGTFLLGYTVTGTG